MKMQPSGARRYSLPSAQTWRWILVSTPRLVYPVPELPKVRLMNDARRKAIRKLWQWVLTSKKSDNTPRAETAEQALEWIRGYFTRARDNDFLMGRGQRSGEHANWQCDLDFLLTDRGMKHVLEKTRGAS